MVRADINAQQTNPAKAPTFIAVASIADSSKISCELLDAISAWSK